MNKHWESYHIATILGCPQELTGKPLLLKTHIFWAQNKQKNQVDSCLEVCSLVADFHSARRAK